jgi:tetratricopeptide (TPR) repeat protein
LLFLLPGAAASRAPLQARSALDEARSLVRQGLLAEALDALSGVPADAPAGMRGNAALVEGNVRYERGDYPDAESSYRRAIELLESDRSDGADVDGGLQAARSNLASAREQLVRASALSRRAAWLRAITAAAALIALAGIAGCSRRLSRHGC